MDLLVEELSASLPNGREFIRFAFRLLLAAVLGGVIGYDRERAGKAAGLRTHMLVSLGAAIYVVAGLNTGMDSDGLSRVIQGLVTGIGFLGGGAIIRERGNVEGLTTAAGIWLTAGVGVAVGLGALGMAIGSVVLCWIILRVLVRLDTHKE